MTTETSEVAATPQSESQEQAQTTEKTVRLTNEEFGVIWMQVAASENPSHQKVAELTGYTVNTVKQKSSAIRKAFEAQGLILPKFPTGGGKKGSKEKISVETLEAKCAELGLKLERKAVETAPADTEAAPAPQEGEKEADAPSN